MKQLQNHTRAKPANYYQATVPRHRGNPLIEALPPIPTDDELYGTLAVDLHNLENERKLLPHLRIQCVNALNDWFEPLDYHVAVARRIDTMLREGYVGRNPLNASTLRHSHYVSTRGKDGVPPPAAENRTARSMFLTGLSRVGKSRTIARALSLYPQYLVHSEYEKRPLPLTQITWIHASCPKNGSIRDACINIIDRIDNVLGQPVYRERMSQYARSGNTGLIPLVERAAREISLGMLAFDEINRLHGAKIKQGDIPPFLHELIDTVGIPVLFCGTYAAYGYFRGSFQEIARITGNGKLEIPRFVRGELWHYFMECLWENQWLTEFQPLTEEDVDLFYVLTKGVQEFAIILWRSAQIHAISNGQERVTHDVLRHIASTELELLQKPLEILDSNDMQAKLAYFDMVPARDDILSARDRYVEEMLTREIAEIVIQHIDKRWETAPAHDAPSLNENEGELPSAPANTTKRRRGKKSAPLEPDDVRNAAEAKDAEKALRDAGMMNLIEKLNPKARPD